MSGGGSSKVTVGFKYYLGMHMILCHGPIDSISRLLFDGKVGWSGTSTGGQISVNSPSLFGGEEREGGVSGTIDVEMGGPVQARNSYLQSMLGASIPAFRGVVGLVFRRFYFGNNPYLKRFAARGKRINVRQSGGIPQWYLAKADVGGDMNPAHLVREVLTDPDWGMGYPELDVDDVSFTAAADLLHSEGMGISLLWDRQQPLSDFLAVVLRHVDGSLYTDRLTGKFVLKLARGGYSVPSLLVLDEESVERVTDFKRATVAELTNQVSVIYWDKSTGKNGSQTVTDIALVAQQGATIGTTVQYPGFTNGTIANRAASRDLKALSTPIASATLYASRKASGLNVGDVFVFSWAEYGIDQIVFRVTNVELGELTSNLIKLTVVEDVFALSAAVYSPPPPSEWTDPIGNPVAASYRLLTEVPYYLIAREKGDSVAAALPATATYAMAVAANPSNAFSAQIYINEGAGYVQQGILSFAPTALTSAVTPIGETSTIAITGGQDLDQVAVGDIGCFGFGASNALEFFEVVSITDTSLSCKRGMLDTTPSLTLASGTRLLFLGRGEFVGEVPVEYAPGESISCRLLPTTGKGTLAIGSAPTDTLLMAGRQDRPNPPGRLRVNTLTYPAEVNGVLTATWSHRDRLQMTAQTLVDQTAGNIGPEAGTTYTARWYLDNVLVRTQTGITSGGTGDSYTPPGGSAGKVVRVEVDSVRDGLTSIMPLRHQFTYAVDLLATEANDELMTEADDNIILE